MKHKLILGLLLLAGFPFLNSCKDDEPPIVGIFFETEEQEVLESDGTLQSLHPEIEGLDDPGEGRIITVRLAFERALAGDVVLKFDLDGTARETSTSQELSDFEIMEEGENITVNEDEITILNGTAEAAFQIVIFEDLRFEYDETGDFNDEDIPYETIELTLESIVSGPGKLGTELEHTLKILEDDAVAFLVWEPQDMEPAEALVDMDMIVWFEDLQWTAGAQAGTGFEGFFIPAGLGNGEVGFSYTYYSGNSDDLDFESAFFNTAGQLEGTKYTYPVDQPLLFNGTYTLANINEYSDTSPPKIAQTATKDGVDYDDFSGLTSFTEGSRAGKIVASRLDKSILTGIAAKQKHYRSLKWDARN